MRISDWSSDVCSSDLTVHLNHAAFGATPKIVLQAAEDWRRRMEAAPTRFMEEELPAALRSAATKLAEFLGGQGDDLVFVDNATTRSEEHTSELQSLMRISYAVFCLKKNKTKLKQQQ